MTNYIQAYATCNQSTFTGVLQRFRDTLTRLGCTDEAVFAWLSTIEWPASDDDNFGDIYAAPISLAPEHAEPIICSSIAVSLYTQPAVPSVEELPSWLGFNLHFDSEVLKESEIALYTPEVGRTVWRILQELAHAFPELGAYFTDEWQENQAWRVLAENAGDPWAFELAIFPRSLASHFAHVPAGFKGTVVDGGFGFAQENRWQTLPWPEP